MQNVLSRVVVDSTLRIGGVLLPLQELRDELSQRLRVAMAMAMLEGC